LENAAEPEYQKNARALLEIARTAASRAVAANEQLRSYVGRSTGETKPLELGMLVQRALEAVAEECPGAIRLRWQAASCQSCYVRANDLDLLAVFIHLMLAAIASMSRGEVQIDAQMEALPTDGAMNTAEFVEVRIQTMPDDPQAPVAGAAANSALDQPGMDARVSPAVNLSRNVVTGLGGSFRLENDGARMRQIAVRLPRLTISS
jgi:hypothetical protein